MPANKEAFIRYRIIDGCLRDKQKRYPGIDELAAACEEVLGTGFSISTIQKDIYAMRFDEGLNYNAPIEYDRYNKGYCYTDANYTISSIPLNGDEINAIEFATGILEQFKGTGLHEQFDNAVEKILQVLSIRKILKNEQSEKVIQVEKAQWFKGSEHLSVLLDYIRKNTVINFDYNSFERDVAKNHELHPYLLKEYRNRWYVIGYHPVYQSVRTFGIDRISNLKATSQSFSMIKDFDPDVYFKHCIGITLAEKPVEVVLSFSALGGKYVKTQSLHETQKILIDTKDELRVSINVMPCYELKMLILGYGDEVKVIKPKFLADDIKQTLKKSLDNY